MLRVRRLLPSDPSTRRLSVAYMINAGGIGLYFAGGALYFVRALHLTFTQVGTGLSVAAAIGLVAGIPFGHAADRFGAARMFALLLASEGAALLAYVWVSGFTAFLVTATVVAVSLQGGGIARSALIPDLVAPTETAKVRSYLTAVGNVGITVGAAIAGFLLQIATEASYHALMILDAATSFAAAALVIGLRTTKRSKPAQSVSDNPAPKLSALRDTRYMTLTGLNSIMTLQYQVLTFALPLWVVERTHAPHWMVSTVLVANTILVVLLQVRLSAGVKTTKSAAAAVRRSGGLLFAACLLFGAASLFGAAAAITLLLVGAVAHTFGEMWQSNGSFSLSYMLAPENAHGQYQGVYSLSTGASAALAPILLTVLCLNEGLGGWVVLGISFLLTGALTVPCARRGEPLPRQAESLAEPVN